MTTKEIKMGSIAAKSTLAGACAVSAFIVYGVHYLQVQERHTMYQGVVKDEARVAAKKLARQKEFEEQAIRRAHLEAHGQTVSGPAQPLPAGVDPKNLPDVSFEGCKTCS